MKERAKQKRYEALTELLVSGLPAQLALRHDERGSIDGYIVGLSKKFVLLHVKEDEMYLNGYAVFPLREVRKARVLDKYNWFAHKALRLQGEYSVPQPDLDLSSFPALLASADAKFPLIVLHPGKIAPDTCYIGRVAELKRTKVNLREISPAARWERSRTYRFQDITQVSFGDRYAAALWRVSEAEGHPALLTEGADGENE